MTISNENKERGHPELVSGSDEQLETFHKSLKYSHSGLIKQCEKKAAKLQSDRAAKLKDNAQRKNKNTCLNRGWSG